MYWHRIHGSMNLPSKPRYGNYYLRGRNSRYRNTTKQ